MPTPSKTIGSSAIAWQDITNTNQIISSAIDVSTKWGMALNIQLGRRSGTAFTAGWPNIRIEASGKASGTDKWIPLLTLQPAVGASIVNTTLNGAVSAGATSFVVTAATNIAVGDLLYLDGDTDAGNEIVRVKGVSGTTITPEEAVTNAHASGNAVTDQAEMYFPALRVTEYGRVRVVADNANSGQTIALEVLYNLFDSF